MVLDKINNYTRRQRGGFALLYGGILMAVAGLLEPGGVLIGGAERVDFSGRVEAMLDYAGLAHATSAFIAIAAVTLLAGLMVVWNTAHEEGLNCTGTRYGLLMVGLGLGTVILGEGIDQMMLIALLDGLGAGFAAGGDSVMQVAVTMHAVKAGLAFIGMPLFMMGMSSMAVGLYPILPPGLHRKVALLVSVIGIVWVVLFWIVAALVDFEGWNAITGFAVAIPIIWLMMLGRTMTNGKIGAHNNV